MDIEPDDVAITIGRVQLLVWKLVMQVLNLE